MTKSKRRKITELVCLTIITILLATSLALLTIVLTIPEEHTIEYELIFDNPILLYTEEAIHPDLNPEYYIEETYEDIKHRNSTIYVCKIEESFESEGKLGEKKKEIYNQVFLFYYNENDTRTHYVKYEARSRYDMKTEMNATYLKITFKGTNI